MLLLHPDLEYPLSELAATIGLPPTTVQREVTRLSSAQLIQERRTIAVAIYGSRATRYEGVAGHPPNDVDVLLIGEVSRRDIYEATGLSEQRLGLPETLSCVPWPDGSRHGTDHLGSQGRTARRRRLMRRSTGEATV